jgi:cbb3-type cytochrome oxidase subunit 3
LWLLFAWWVLVFLKSFVCTWWILHKVEIKDY